MKKIFFALKATRRDVRGASAVEFALVCGPLFLMLFGVVEFARAMWAEEALSQTANTVSRCIGLSLTNCMVNGSYSATAATSYAQTLAQGWLLTVPSGNVSLATATSCPGMTGFTTFVSVKITYQFSTVVTSLIPPLANKTLTGQACFPQGTA